MITPQSIVLLCWLAFMVYWALNWGNVKPTQHRDLGFWYLRIIMAVLIIAFIFLAKKFSILPPCQVTWSGCHFNIISSQISIPALQVVGTALTLIGLGIALIARRTLGQNWSLTIDLKTGHELITQGIYGYVRHPIYTGFILMGLGTILVAQNFLVMLFFISQIPIFLSRIGHEEKLMTQTFPKDYPAYKKRSKTLIPFIW